MENRQYNLRRHPASPSPHQEMSTTTREYSVRASSTSSRTNTSSSVRSAGYSGGIPTPAPVQRTLYTQEGDFDEDDEDDEAYEDEESTEDEEDEDDEDFDDLEVEEVDHFGETVRLVGDDVDEDTRWNSSNAGSIVSKWRSSDLGRRLGSTWLGRQLGRYGQRLWNYVVRNSFLAANLLWLLAPLGCFLIAIMVPQYITTAIRYVDVLTMTINGTMPLTGSFEKGSMRSIVQEIVDVKLSTMNEELSTLRKTLEAQEREVEAIRVLHESFRQVHEDYQKKFSLADSKSAIAIHIDRVVSKYTQDLLSNTAVQSSKVEAALQTTASQQEEMMDMIQGQQKLIDAIQCTSNDGINVKNTADLLTKQEARQELSAWKTSLQQDLDSEIQRELSRIDERVFAALRAQKVSLYNSANADSDYSSSDPALETKIENVVMKSEASILDRVDHAALVNGAVVVYSERDLLQPSYSSFQLVSDLFALQSPQDQILFTSQSHRKAPLFQIGSLFTCGEIPWWLSRHNGRPETALSETMEIGSCWGLGGSSGRLSVKFANPIVPDSITIDHISKGIASDFSSAPRHFRILGLVTDQDRQVVNALPLGNFSYSRNGPASQTFKLAMPHNVRSGFDGVTLEITTNHGNQEYTCLYRFRVHGSST